MVRIVRLGFGALILVSSLPAFASRCDEILYALSEKSKLILTKQSEGRRTTEYSAGANATLSVSCISGAPDIALTWDGLSPDDDFYNLVGAAGSLVTRRPADEVIQYSKQCRHEALKDSVEISMIQKNDVVIECQAFERNGGGAIFSIFAN